MSEDLAKYKKKMKKQKHDNHKKILSPEKKLILAIDFIKNLIEAKETGKSNGKDYTTIRDEAITFINELV
jgi:hypothetical protein